MFSAASVCLFVCQHNNFRTSKHRMMKLGGRCTLRKSRLGSNFGVKNVALGYDVGTISAQVVYLCNYMVVLLCSGRLSTNSNKDWMNNAAVTEYNNTRPSSVVPAISTPAQDTAQRSVGQVVVVLVVVVVAAAAAAKVCRAGHDGGSCSTSTLGDFTFWISLSLSLFAQSKD